MENSVKLLILLYLVNHLLD